MNVNTVSTLSLSQVIFRPVFPPLRCIYTLYLMNDSYLGLDQQYDVHLNVTPASIAAQVNSEVSHSDLSLG